MKNLDWITRLKKFYKKERKNIKMRNMKENTQKNSRSIQKV